MKTIARRGIVVLGLITAGPSFAQELGFSLVSASSVGVGGPSCNMNTVHLISAGTDMTLVFDNMNADLPAGGSNRSLVATSNCTIAVKMIIPKGTYLMQTSSTISGGVEKNKGSVGSISSSAFLTRTPTTTIPLLGTVGLATYSRKDYGPLQVLSDALVALTDTKKSTLLEQRTMCGWTKSNAVTVGMLLRVGVSAIRSNPNTQTAIFDIDNSDTSFNVGMSTGKCL